MISVLEVTKRCTLLQEYGKRLGFTVSTKDDFFVWKSDLAGEYFLYPYSDEKDIKKIDIDGYILYVCIGDKKSFVPEKNKLSLDSIRLLVEKVEKGKLEKSILKYWKLVYGSNGIDNILDMADSNFDQEELGENQTERKGSGRSKQYTKNKKKKETKEKKVQTKYDLTPFVQLLDNHFGVKLINTQDRSLVDNSSDICVIPLISKEYSRANNVVEYWYSVHSYQIKESKGHKSGYYAFCMSAIKRIALVSQKDFSKLCLLFTTSPNKGDIYWHVKIRTNGNTFWFVTRRELDNIYFDEYPHVELLDIDSKQNQGSKVLKISDGNLHEITCKKKK